VEKVAEEKERIIAEVRAVRSKDLDCPRSTSKRLYRHGTGKRRKVLHSWNNGNFIQL